MTKFLCIYDHEFSRPDVLRDLEHGRDVWVCPECETEQFRVIELGGPATPADDCEGACTL